MSWRWSGDDLPPRRRPERPLTDLYIRRLVRHTVAQKRNHPTSARPERRVDWALVGAWTMYAVGVLIAAVIVYAVFAGWR